MLEKEKILKIEIYDSKEKFITATKVFSFPKELFKAKGTVLMLFKSNALGKLKKGDTAILIFEYINGTRHRCQTRIDKAEKSEYEVRIGELTEIKERRASFKVSTNEPVIIYKSKSEKEEGKDGKILNINLGGVLLKYDDGLVVGQEIYLNMLGGELELRTRILRRQLDAGGKFVGYGCQFLDVEPHEEEIIAKFILQCQVEERKRRAEMG